MNNQKSKFKSIAIIGLGLIGGSIAKLIRKTHPNLKISGLSRRSTTIQYALANNIIDQGTTNYSELPQDLDLAFICTPIHLIQSATESLSQSIQNDLTITDVASVKEKIANMPKNLRENHLFIPGHPMAGKETTGIENSKAAILENTKYLLIPDPNPKYNYLKDFISGLGFTILELTPTQHDYLVGLASHLPYLMACLTVSPTLNLTNKDFSLFKQIISTGFFDTTRVAESSVEWGMDICQTNKKNLLQGLKTIKENLVILEELIVNDKSEDIRTFLTAIQNKRQSLYK